MPTTVICRKGGQIIVRKRRFIQCDVFSPVPTRGNGLAVIVDAEGLSDAQMKTFAAWTNLAETTFLLPPPILALIISCEFFTDAGDVICGSPNPR